MKIRILQSQFGFGLVESSLCFVLFCSLLMLGTGLWDFVEVNNGLTVISDRYAYQLNKGAYQYNKQSGTYQLDLNNLKQKLNSEVIPEALVELKKELRTERDSQLRLDFAVTVVEVDGQTGAVVKIPALTTFGSAGTATIPEFLLDGDESDGDISFDRAISDYVNKAAGTLAIPTQGFGTASNYNRFLTDVPIVAVRTLYRYESSNFLVMLGVLDQPYAWDIKVSALRGEVG